MANYYNHIVICDPDPREKEIGETAEVLREGLLKGGFKMDMISMVLNEREATLVALDMARKGDLVVLQVDDLNQVIEDVLAYKTKLEYSHPKQI